MLYVTLIIVVLVPTTFCKLTYQLNVPITDGFPYAKLLGTIDRPLEEFTLCHWSRYTGDQGWGTAFSYSNAESRDLILSRFRNTDINYGYYLFRYHNITSSWVKTNLNPVRWQHVCATMTTVFGGRLSVFINGTEQLVKNENVTSYPIPANGLVVVGQDAEEKEGIFHSKQYEGGIADVYMWDRVLTAAEILAVYKCTGTEDANVINWNLNTWQLHNKIRA